MPTDQSPAIEVPEAAAFAAAWWASHLTRNVRLDNGDAYTSAVMNMFHSLDRTPLPPPEQVERFRDCIAAIIAVKMAERQWVNINHDYGPDATLSAAIEASELDTRSYLVQFPLKTQTVIENGTVAVYGYRTGPRVIFPAQSAT